MCLLHIGRTPLLCGFSAARVENIIDITQQYDQLRVTAEVLLHICIVPVYLYVLGSESE